MATATLEEMDVVDAYAVLIRSLSDVQRNALIERLLWDLERDEHKTKKSLRSLKGILSSNENYDMLRTEALEEKHRL